MEEKITTRCPACGNQTLFIGSGGHITCSWIKCTEPGLEHFLKERGVFAQSIPQREAIAEVLEERTAQDAIWRGAAYPVMSAQYEYAAPHILVLEECVSKLRKIWYGSKDEGTLRERFRKTAACALRAMEEVKHTRES